MRRIYLDYNATTPIAPSVHEAMEPYLTEHFGNPSSSHVLGRITSEAIQEARGCVAGLIGADCDEIVFTSGGTESNNLALIGALWPDTLRTGSHLIISVFEHPAVEAPARFLKRQGIALTIVPCTEDGVVDPNEIRRAIRPETRLVSIMHANNEIGTIQPIRAISTICHERDILLHTDAAQSVGKIRVNVNELGVDLLSIAGHKLYAPKGVGALFVRRSVTLQPVLHGAGHERGLRPGTENVASLVGLGKAATLAARALETETERMAALRDRLLDLLKAEIGDQLTVNGFRSPRLPNTLSANFPSVAGAELLQRVPEICASTGSACHADQVSMSKTLTAIRLEPQQARGTVRLSLGAHTSVEDVDRTASLLLGAWQSLT